MRVGTHELTPFMLGAPSVTDRFMARSPVGGMVARDALAADEQTFYRLLNAGNQHAFGGMGMPAWVQLDCCTLPTAMVGFSLARSRVDPRLYEALVQHVGRVFGTHAEREAQAYQGEVPLSEYCALATPTAGTVVGFSLFSLLHGVDLGIRTKALALLCYGAQRQVGLTQYNNSAVKTHVLLGPLTLTHATAPPHSRPRETFVYEVDVSNATHLRSLVNEGACVPRSPAANTFVPVVDAVAAAGRVEALKAASRTVQVVWPGLREEQGGLELCLAVE
jgi:hypothetical protein